MMLARLKVPFSPSKQLAWILMLSCCLASQEGIGKNYTEDACSVAPYRDLCIHSLASFSNQAKQDPSKWARAGVSVTIGEAKKVAGSLASLKRNGSGLVARGRNRIAVSDCVECFQDALDNLHESLEVLRNLNIVQFGSQMEDVTTWVSAALTDEDTCLDGFDQGKGKHLVSVLNCVSKVSYMTSNALALVNKLATTGPGYLTDDLKHRRSCYDEGKRTAETLTMDYHRGAGVEVRIARIFNTYGPRMCIDDGRVVSNFVAQALRKEPLTVYGDGKQTRSFQFVSDLVEGLMRLMEGEYVGPFNLGNPGESTMLELAKVVQDTIDSSAKIEFRPNTEDDPHKRKPDITKAKEQLGWEPKVSLREGLPMMVSDFRQRIFGDHRENGGKIFRDNKEDGGRISDEHKENYVS